jgi:hypothetical protein
MPLALIAVAPNVPVVSTAPEGSRFPARRRQPWRRQGPICRNPSARFGSAMVTPLEKSASEPGGGHRAGPARLVLATYACRRLVPPECVLAPGSTSLPLPTLVRPPASLIVPENATSVQGPR